MLQGVVYAAKPETPKRRPMRAKEAAPIACRCTRAETGFVNKTGLARNEDDPDHAADAHLILRRGRPALLDLNQPGRRPRTGWEGAKSGYVTGLREK